MSPRIKNRIKDTFRALRQRNYRLFFIGQSISLIGSWIQNIALSWLVYRLTNSAMLMGTVTFINALPALITAPAAGVIIDRVNKYKMLIALQSCFLLLALILAVLTLLKVIALWQIVVLGVLTNAVAAFDMPLRQAMVIHLVNNPKDLSNAISLNSSNFNMARLVGPAIAGLLIGEFGEGLCFLINAVSYIAVIWALLLMRLELPDTTAEVTKNLRKGFTEGLRYVKNSPPIKILLLYLAFVSFIGVSYPLLMPIYADRILNGNAQTLGILMSCSGIGALTASLILAAEKTPRRLPWWIYIGSLTFGLSFAALGLFHHRTAAYFFLFCLGFGMIIGLISCNTLLQGMVENSKRGRVMSLYTLAFIGTLPFGNLFGGWLAQRIGIAHAYLLLGILLIISSFWFWNKQQKTDFFSVQSSTQAVIDKKTNKE